MMSFFPFVFSILEWKFFLTHSFSHSLYSQHLNLKSFPLHKNAISSSSFEHFNRMNLIIKEKQREKRILWEKERKTFSQRKRYRRKKESVGIFPLRLLQLISKSLDVNSVHVSLFWVNSHIFDHKVQLNESM